MKVCGECEMVYEDDTMIKCPKCHEELVEVPFKVGDKVKVGYCEDDDLNDWTEENNIEILTLNEIDPVNWKAWADDCEFGLDMDEIYHAN